jgi:hypothetical protein
VNKRIELIGNKATKCHTFILPMFGLKSTLLPNNYINTYIYDSNSVVLVCSKPEEKEISGFDRFLATINENGDYSKYEDTSEEILLYFTIPDNFKSDFNKIIKGEYSKTSTNYKSLIVKAYGRTSIKDTYKVTAYNTLYPQEFKRKQIADRLGVETKLISEVLDSPDLNYEIYKPLHELTKQNLHYDNQ